MLGDNQYEQMTAQLHYECSVMQADGRHDPKNDPRYYRDATDLFAAGVKGHITTQWFHEKANMWPLHGVQKRA